MTGQAEAFARGAFGSRAFASGEREIQHAANVARRFAAGTPEHDAGWLHDVVEDCPHVYLRDMLEAGIARVVVDAVKILTRHKQTDSYGEYVARICETDGEAGRIARAVKLADAEDNIARIATYPGDQATAMSVLKKWEAAKRKIEATITYRQEINETRWAA